VTTVLGNEKVNIMAANKVEDVLIIHAYDIQGVHKKSTSFN